MGDLDEMLDGMRSAPLPSRLDTIDKGVLLSLSEHQANSVLLSGGMVGFVIIAAMGMGVLSTIIPGSSVETGPSLSPFSATVALAPSTLLGSSE